MDARIALSGTSPPSPQRVLTFPAEEVRSVDFRGQEVVYLQMPIVRYGFAVDALVKACNGDTQSRQPLLDGVPRALTMRENFIARLMDPSLQGVYLDSCAGIAYSSADADAFKLAPVCPELMRMPPNSNSSALPCDYTTFTGIPLRKSGANSHSHLDRDQFLSHEGWFTLLEGDRDLMNASADAMYGGARRKAFGFPLWNSVPSDQIHRVFVDGFSNYSRAGGCNHLSDVRFLRIVQR